MPRYVLTPSARADLAAVRAYLQARSLDASELMAARFDEAFARLAEFPGIGHARPDLTHRPLRFWSVRPYLIVYLPHTSPLRIVRIIHSAQDARVMLDPEVP